MKIKNFQVYDEQNQKAINELMSKDLRGATALKVVKIARKLDELLKDINESIKIIREKYTFKDENGKVVHPVDESGNPILDRIRITNPTEFQKEIEEILNVENEIYPEMELISEEEITGVNISPNTIMFLGWMIKI